MTTSQPILSLKPPGIVVPLGGVAGVGKGPVLLADTLQFEVGTVTALLGINGSGKTTLLRTLAGLAQPTTGGVLLGGKLVQTLPPGTRAQQLAYVAQRSDVSEAFSAKDVVGLGLFAAAENAGGKHAMLADAALARVDAAHLADQPVTTLSAGERQRVAIARVLVQLGVSDAASQTGEARGPRVLLADEPTSAMDPLHALRTLALLQQIAGQGIAVVLAMHDVALALRTCRRVVLLSRQGTGNASVTYVGESANLDSTTLAQTMGVTFADVSVMAGTHEGLRVRAGFASLD